MSDKTDLKTDSVTALRNVSKHLTDVFKSIDNKDLILRTSAADLQHTANQCGDLRIEVWNGSTKEIIFLKTYLLRIATSLNGARS